MLCRTVEQALVRVGDEEPLLCARDGDVGEAALLRELLGVGAHRVAGEDALLRACEKDDGKFKTLCRVNGH